MTSGPSFPQPEHQAPPLPQGSYATAAARAKPAAIAMIVYNALSIGHGLLAIPFVVGYRAMIDELAKQNSDLRPIADLLREPQLVAFVVVLLGVGLLASILGVVGAVAMLRLKSYALAMTAAILTVVGPGGCCCVVGIPIGIWAMVVLMKAEVQAAFTAPIE